MKVQIQIERLILDGLGLTPAQGALVQAAVETELTRLLRARGFAPALLHGGALPTLAAGSIQLAEQGSPAQIGTQIAQALMGGIGGEK
jgi:hypothetical protein